MSKRRPTKSKPSYTSYASKDTVDGILAKYNYQQGTSNASSSNRGSAPATDGVRSRKEAMEGYRPNRGADSSDADDNKSDDDSDAASETPAVGRGGSTRYSRHTTQRGGKRATSKSAKQTPASRVPSTSKKAVKGKENLKVKTRRRVGKWILLAEGFEEWEAEQADQMERVLKRSGRAASKKAQLHRSLCRIPLPTSSHERVLVNHGLRVASHENSVDVNDDHLAYDTSWTPEQLDAHLHELFPGPFEYLNENYPIPAGASNTFQWIALSKEKGGLVEYDGPACGLDLLDLATPHGKRGFLQKLYFATTHTIPERYWRNKPWQTDKAGSSNGDEDDEDEAIGDHKTREEDNQGEVTERDNNSSDGDNLDSDDGMKGWDFANSSSDEVEFVSLTRRRSTTHLSPSNATSSIGTGSSALPATVAGTSSVALSTLSDASPFSWNWTLQRPTAGSHLPALPTGADASSSSGRTSTSSANIVSGNTPNVPRPSKHLHSDMFSGPIDDLPMAGTANNPWARLKRARTDRSTSGPTM